MNVGLCIKITLDKGYDVSFKEFDGRIGCCVEYDNQYPGAKPFAIAETIEKALTDAIIMAKVPQS